MQIAILQNIKANLLLLVEEIGDDQDSDMASVKDDAAAFATRIDGLIATAQQAT